MKRKGLSKSGLVDFVNAGVEIIKNLFGINLNWSEKIGLKFYFKSFWNSYSERNMTRSPSKDAIHYFMCDYFGLDFVEIGNTGIASLNCYYGLDFLGDERFKEYCRRNVDLWRQERDLL